MASRIDQRGAAAGQDVVAGNKTVNHLYPPQTRAPGIVEQLLEKLQSEITKNAEVRHTVESLQYFYERKAKDGVIGLEAKLTAGNRGHELYLALAKKEQFAKLLEKWSMYASAQEIFAYLLAGVEHQFSMFVHPQIGALDEVAINQLVSDRIVLPTIAECGTSVFTLNHSLVMGMVYWLAEQCFVRWHE
jgi:hypothetical protein